MLTDEMVDEFESGATVEERAELDALFDVERIYNRQREARHVVSFSLFWKPAYQDDPDLPDLDRRTLKNAHRRGLVKRFRPWSHYVQPLLDCAPPILQKRPEVSFRVYLAQDLKFLAKDLVKAGCEVRLMKSSSIRHNPGAMWRYLALEDKGRLVTICDSDAAAKVEFDMLRTEEAANASLGMWRVPVWGDISEIGEVLYRPMFGGPFGVCTRLSAGKLMKACLWHHQRGTLSRMCQVPACGELPINGSIWPSYGFDEYFLIAAVYPRLARKGILSFIPTNARSQFMLLDIEYATWANPRSEIVYFGAGGCCGPIPHGEMNGLNGLNGHNGGNGGNGGNGHNGVDGRALGRDARTVGLDGQEAKIDETMAEFFRGVNGGPPIVSTNPDFSGLKKVGDFLLVSTEGLTRRHRLPAWAQRPQPLREDITGDVWAWFNPASVVWRGKRWLAYRTECLPLWHWTRTNLVNLDAEFRPIPETNRGLDLPTRFGRWGGEDPRLIVYEDRLLLSYCDGYQAGLAEIGEDGSLIKGGLLSKNFFVEGVTPEKDRREKNWGFFTKDEKLFVAYWVSPHVVFEFDPVRKKMGEHWNTAWTPPAETRRLHGSSAPVWHDGLFWRVVHSSYSDITNGRARRYRLWLMAFEDNPPYAPRWFCRKPLVVAEPEMSRVPEPVYHHVVFCGSMERVENGWLLFFGENDLRIRYGVIEDETISPHLMRVDSGDLIPVG